MNAPAARAALAPAAPRPWSLRRRLTAVVLLVVGLSLACLSVLLYLSVRRALWAQFDRRLEQDARAVAAMVEDRGDHWELEFGEPLDPKAHEGGPWYGLWREGGELLTFFWGPGGTAPAREPGPATPRFLNLRREGGPRLRTLRERLPPRLDEGIRSSGRMLEVLVARPTAEVEEALSLLLAELLAATALVSLLAALLSVALVGRGLAAVAFLGKRIDQIDAAQLGERLPADGLPVEFGPTAGKLNELLARLESSFERERRFSADVAHELRTPIAGLLAVLEVAASRERSADAYLASLREAVQTAHQMRALVEALLALARAESGALPPAPAWVDLCELAHACLAPLAAEAARRGLRVENRIAPGTRVRADPGRLRAILQNLLGNAVAYTESGGFIALCSDPARGLWLSVIDSGPQLPPEVLERIFDRFFRLDPSRSVGEHHGLGLSLVRALAGSMGLSVRAENRPDGTLAFLVEPSSAEAPPTDP